MNVTRTGEPLFSGQDITTEGWPLRDYLRQKTDIAEFRATWAPGLGEWGFIYDTETKRLYLGHKAFDDFYGFLEAKGESA